MKLLVMPKSINHLNSISNKCDGFIVGLSGYSLFCELKLDIPDIKDLCKNNKVYVLINKLLFNDDLSIIKSKLIELSKLSIAGIMYEDVSILKLNNDLGLNLNLIWSSMHLPTNSLTCSYWRNKCCSGAFLSTELMIDDFINIKNNTDMDIFVYLYGHVPIFESSRELISNYFSHINKVKKDNVYYMYEKSRDKYYPIYEEYNNSYILEDILNGINDVKKLGNIDYAVLNSLLIDEDVFNKELDDYIDALNGKEFNKNVFTGFLHKESIFRVK